MKTINLNTEQIVALLIGASDFQDENINNIPNIETNIKMLKTVLKNKNLLGITFAIVKYREANLILVLFLEAQKVKSCLAIQRDLHFFFLTR